MNRSNTIRFLAAVLFLLVAYWPVSGLQYAMKYDIMDWFYPMRYLIGECLQNGVLPLWNPYTNLGYPLHADPQSGALYPIVWIIGYFLGYSPYTINFEYILHVIFAFYGMKKLCEVIGLENDISLIVGVCYACCGFFVGNAQHLTWIISAAWIPFIFYYYYKLIKENSWKDAFGLSIFSFLLLTGGYPAFSIIVFYILLIFFLFNFFNLLHRKEYACVKRFFLNNCLFFILFVLQGLTFFVFLSEVLDYMVRSDSLSLAEAQLLPFSPQSYISFILPFTTGGNAAFYQTDISMANGYFGLIGLLFCGLGLLVFRNKRIFLLALGGLFFLLIALGDFSFLRAWLFHNIPLMNLFRYPALFRVFALICFLILFGITFQKYWNDGANTLDWKKLRRLIIFLTLVVTGIFLFAFQKSAFLFPTQLSAKAISTLLSQSTNSQMVLIQAPIQIFLLCFLLFITYWKGQHFKKYLVLIIALDLFLSVQLNIFITVISDQKATILQEKVKQLPKGFPIPKENVSATSHYGNGDYYPIWFNNNILLKKIAYDGYNNFILKSFKQFNDSPGKMEKLKFPILHFDDSAIFKDSLINQTKRGVEIQSFNPTNVKAKVKLSEKSKIIFLQADYPGWQVKLNGNTIPHFKTENIFIAAEIPAGEHVIEYNFYPKNYLYYLGISAIAFLLALIGTLKFCWRKTPGEQKRIVGF